MLPVETRIVCMVLSCTTCFLVWICFCAMQILHNLSQRQVRSWMICDHDLIQIMICLKTDCIRAMLGSSSVADAPKGIPGVRHIFKRKGVWSYRNSLFAEDLVRLGFLYCSLFPISNQSQPTKKNIGCGKKWAKCHFLPKYTLVGCLSRFWFGLGWVSCSLFPILN